MMTSRSRKRLDGRENEIRIAKLLQSSLLTLEEENRALRLTITKRKEEIAKELSKNAGKGEDAILEATKHFYDHAKDELMKIEEICQEYHLKIMTDVSAEGKERLQLPSRVPFAKIIKILEKQNFHITDSFNEEGNESCKCLWKNTALPNLEPTRNVISRPKETGFSKFDDSDLKFKQELTLLRMKTFSRMKSIEKPIFEAESFKEPLEGRRSTIGLSSNRDFIEKVMKMDSFVTPSVEEAKKIGYLKFVDASFKDCPIWTKLLDAHGRQLRSKWCLVLRPQIEKLLRNRRVPSIRLNSTSTFKFLSKIPENGVNFTLSKRDLLQLLAVQNEAKWLNSWVPQMHEMDGKDVAAMIIQKTWRGHQSRKRLKESECKYIAASVLWCSWIVVKKKRQMHERYLRRMLTSLTETKELMKELIRDFDKLIQGPHVVVHLPSLGYRLDARRNLPAKVFRIQQNFMSLKISFLRNPNAEVIYILPVKATQNLLAMYYDILESVQPGGNYRERITFLSLSEAKTFENRSLNVSRILHCSKDTMEAILQKVSDKPAYILPWIMDECDVRVSGNLKIPYLCPEMALQQDLLNKSFVSDFIKKLGLSQPVCVSNIKDYNSLCSNLAELICSNCEICMWLIKLNLAASKQNSAIFLINHITVPFMPELRKQAEFYGDRWKAEPELRSEFQRMLAGHLPRVVSMAARIPSLFRSWKEFYSHMVKVGCLIQAVLSKKVHTSVIVNLFIPGLSSGRKPEWTGTADQIRLEDAHFSTFGFMFPMSSMNVAELKPSVDEISRALQEKGYFGYLAIDLYCYPTKNQEKMKVLVVDMDPYYSYSQNFIDWVIFAIKGSYDVDANTFEAGIDVTHESRRRQSSVMMSDVKLPTWDDTSERCAVGIEQLFHGALSSYKWPRLKLIAESSGIKFDPVKLQGAHFLLHDGEHRLTGTMVCISPAMKTTLSMTEKILRKFSRALSSTSKKTETNMLKAASLFSQLALDYRNANVDKCFVEFRHF